MRYNNFSYKKIIVFVNIISATNIIGCKNEIPETSAQKIKTTPEFYPGYIVSVGCTNSVNTTNVTIDVNCSALNPDIQISCFAWGFCSTSDNHIVELDGSATGACSTGSFPLAIDTGALVCSTSLFSYTCWDMDNIIPLFGNGMIPHIKC